MSAERADALRRWALKNGYGPAVVEADPEPEAEPEVCPLPDTWRVDTGECVAAMRALPAESVDAVVTDPPYGLGFMGKEWDALPPGVDWAEECLRVLKPGGHLLAFGGTRTYHRLACAIEDGGFEIRDTVAWLYGSGFPKSMDVAKAVTATQTLGSSSRRANRVAMTGDDSRSESFGSVGDERSMLTSRSTPPPRANLTDDALAWSGWGTALKPAHEPVVVARKPLIGTVAVNVLEHGTGAINVDGCRVVVSDGAYARNHSGDRGHAGTRGREDEGATNLHAGGGSASPEGRWPANLILDEEAAALLDESAPETRSTVDRNLYSGDTGSLFAGSEHRRVSRGDSGGPSRFFYVAKASKRERNAGVDKNAHPTVKPIAVMRYLCRLVTPPGGLVLDPFTGSGTTGIAATSEGFRFLGFELDPQYAEIARARIAHWAEEEAA